MPKERVTWIILASSTLTLMTLSALSAIVPLLTRDLKTTASGIGILTMAYAGVVAAVSPLAGRIIDRLGTKTLLVAGLFLYGFAGGAGVVLNSYNGLLISRVAQGAAVAAIFSTITVIIGDLYQGGRFHAMMGLRISVNNFAAIMWPILGGMAGRLSWHATFVIFLTGIPLGLLALIFVPETHRRDIAPSSTDNISIIKVMTAHPILIAVYGLTLLTSLTLGTVVIYLPHLLVSMGTTDPLAIGLYIASLTLAVALASLAHGRVKARLSYLAISMIALVLWTIGFSAIAFAPNKIIIVPAAILIGAGRGLTFPAAIAWAGEIGPENLRGSITSYSTSFIYLGLFLTPIVLTPIESAFGLRAIFETTGIINLALLLGLTAIWAIRRSKPRAA